MKFTELTDEFIYEIFEKSQSFHDFLKKIGYEKPVTFTYNYVRAELKKRNIEIPNFNYSNSEFIISLNKNRRKPNNEVFCENSSYSRHCVKKRIIKENLIQYKCTCCGLNGEWNGKKLSLQLEHKNGIFNDNRLENLSFLCPNCHSQTETYAGKSLTGKKQNKKKKKYYCECGKVILKNNKRCKNCTNIEQRKIKDRPDKEILIEDVEKNGYSATGRKYGVSDNTIRKWLNL